MAQNTTETFLIAGIGEAPPKSLETLIAVNRATFGRASHAPLRAVDHHDRALVVCNKLRV
jgi:hypothetical protein